MRPASYASPCERFPLRRGKKQGRIKRCRYPRTDPDRASAGLAVHCRTARSSGKMARAPRNGPKTVESQQADPKSVSGGKREGCGTQHLPQVLNDQAWQPGCGGARILGPPRGSDSCSVRRRHVPGNVGGMSILCRDQPTRLCRDQPTRCDGSRR